MIAFSEAFEIDQGLVILSDRKVVLRYLKSKRLALDRFVQDPIFEMT